MALSACTIDDRVVGVHRHCMSAPADGLLSDFSTSRMGVCGALPGCQGDELQRSPTVSLGTTGVTGTVFQYRAPPSGMLELQLTGDLSSVSDPHSALRVLMDAGMVDQERPSIVGAFALRFGDCVESAAYAGVSFRVDGELGACELRVAAQLIARDGDPLDGPPCALDDCPDPTTVAVATGVTTILFPGAASGRVLGGLQWELGSPNAAIPTCAADFTLDDLRLVASP